MNTQEQTKSTASDLEFELVDFPRQIDEITPPVNEMWNVIRKERFPDDPPIPLEEEIAGFRNVPEFVEFKLWIAWEPGRQKSAASLEFETYQTEDNQHLSEFEINVAPEYRRQGLGRKFLRMAAEESRNRSKRLMITVTNSNVPAGEAFMAHFGGQRGLETCTNQLVLKELDRQLMADWITLASSQKDRFELGLWDGRYPDEDIQAVADLFLIANDAPHDDLDVEDQTFTPERLRQMENYGIARGTQRWSMYLREKATGRFAGFTEVFYNPNRPTILQQAFTGVHPDFRGLNLGRWLKAEMMHKVLRERAQVRVVRTGNANSNAAMLRINNEMGFKPYMSVTVWQLETDKVFTYFSKP